MIKANMSEQSLLGRHVIIPIENIPNKNIPTFRNPEKHTRCGREHYLKGRLNTVDLLIRVACLGEK
jgi:hypothetical protein